MQIFTAGMVGNIMGHLLICGINRNDKRHVLNIEYKLLLLSKVFGWGLTSFDQLPCTGI